VRCDPLAGPRAKGRREHTATNATTSADAGAMNAALLTPPFTGRTEPHGKLPVAR
jgi:hypothetical protein